MDQSTRLNCAQWKSLRCSWVIWCNGDDPNAPPTFEEFVKEATQFIPIYDCILVTQGEKLSTVETDGRICEEATWLQRRTRACDGIKEQAEDLIARFGDGALDEAKAQLDRANGDNDRAAQAAWWSIIDFLTSLRTRTGSRAEYLADRLAVPMSRIRGILDEIGDYREVNQARARLFEAEAWASAAISAYAEPRT
jgi:hypothetical protein